MIIKMPKVKDKERILKAAREKKLATYREVLSADFLKESEASSSERSPARNFTHHC